MKSKQSNSSYVGKLILGMALCAGSLNANPALAQTAASNSDANTNEVVRLPKFEVTASKVASDSSIGTKIITSLITTPQSVSVVTEAEMSARGVQNLNDAVAFSAGVRPESSGMDSRTETLTIRGYSVSGFGGGTNSNIYLDGLRGLSGGQWSSTSFEPFGLERVEVVKGPSAVLYGQVTPGGLINAVSKRPTGESRDSAAFQYGSFNTVQATFDTSGGSEGKTIRYRLVGLVRNGDSEIDYTDDLQRLFIAPSLTWNIGQRTRLTFLTQYQDDSGGATFQFLPKTGTLTPGLNGFRLARSTFLGEPDWNEFARRQYSLGYQFEHAFNTVVTLHHSLRYLSADTDYKAVVGRGTDADANGTFARRIMWGYGDSGNLTADTYLQSQFSTGAVKHTLLTGVDYYHSSWDHTRWLANTTAINIYAPVYAGVNQAHLAAMLAGNPQLVQVATESQVGAYVQEQAVWGKLHATLGLRHDSYDIDYRNAIANAKTAVNPTATTWRTGLLYLFDNGLAPYASYTTSFDSAPYTTSDANGNTFKEPAKAAQWELGLKYKPKSFAALFTASVFELTEENKLSSYKDIASNQVYNAQSGAARTRGAELEARVQLTEGIDLIAAYTHLDTEITKSSITNNLETKGNELPNVPDDSASLWLSYGLHSGALNGLTLGAGVRHTGETYDNVNNVTRLPDYTLFDASISYDFGRQFSSLKGLSARLSGTNLADKLYVATANVSPVAGGAAVAYYGSGRNVTLSLRYAW